MIVAMSTPPSLMLASAGQVVIRTEKITVLQCLTVVISFTERPDGCTGDWMDDELAPHAGIGVPGHFLPTTPPRIAHIRPST